MSIDNPMEKDSGASPEEGTVALSPEAGEKVISSLARTDSPVAERLAIAFQPEVVPHFTFTCENEGCGLEVNLPPAQRVYKCRCGAEYVF